MTLIPYKHQHLSLGLIKVSLWVVTLNPPPISVYKPLLVNLIYNFPMLNLPVHETV